MANRRDRYTGISSDTERQINQATGELDGRLKTLEQPAGRAGIVKANTVAKVGEFLTIEAPPTGLQLLLPPPTASIRNARVTLSFVNNNPVVISCAGGTVNSGTNVTNNAKGVIECICDGISNWTVPQNVTSGGSVINAEYLVGAAHSGLTNERVATDTTEIDVVLTTPGLVTWVIKNGSVVLTKLEPIADDTFLGNISGGSASPAAISFTSFAGDGISYDATNHQWDVNGSTSIVVTSDEVRRAALTGDITASQNSNTTSFRVFDAKSVLVNATNSSAVPDDLAASTLRHVLRVNDANSALEWGWPVAVFQGGEIDRGDFYALNFSSGTYTTVNTTDEGSGVCSIIYDVNISSLLDAIDSTSIVVSGGTLQRAALTGAISASQNSNATLFAGIQNAGAAATDRTNLNFIGFTVADDAGNDRINITAPSTLPRFDTEQTESGAGPLDVVLSSAAVTRVTFTGTNPTLQDIQGGTDTGRILLCYFNGTGRLKVQHSVAGASGNESRLFNPGNTDLYVGERQGFFAQANGTAGWRTFPFRGSEVIQSFTTAGTSNDVALNGDTTVLRVDTGNSDWSITGFARAGGNFDGDRIVVMNASNNASTGEFLHATGSTAGNQLSLVGSANQRGRRRTATFEYDGPDLAWREIASNGASPFYNDTSNAAGDSIQYNGTQWVSRGTFSSTLAATSSNLAIGDVATVLLSLTGSQSLTGMVPTSDAQIVWLENSDSSDGLTLVHDATSTAANRFYLPGAQDFFIPARSGVWVRYNNTLSRWVLAYTKASFGLAVRNGASFHTGNSAVEFIGGNGVTVASSQSGSAPLAETDVTLSVDEADSFTWTGTHLHAEKASSPTVGSGNGMFWVQNTAPSKQMFTDDVEADWPIGYAALNVITSNAAATAATTNLSFGTYTIPANTLRSGSVYRLFGYFVYAHTAEATADLILEVLINGSVVETCTMQVTNVALTYSGTAEAYIVCRTTGGTGSVMVDCRLESNVAQSTDVGGLGSTATATDSIDTTASRSIEMRMRMAAGVASNTLTVTRGIIERLG